MKLKKSINLILSVAFLLISERSMALVEGDRIISTRVYKQDNSVELSVCKANYYNNRSDKKSRAEQATDWRITLKDKAGNEIDSAYLQFVYTGPSISIYDVDSSANWYDSLLMWYNSLFKKRISASRESIEMADFVCKQTDEAYKVDLYFKGNLKASELVDEDE